MATEVQIERRFRGPAESANGGYCCGVVASAIDAGPAVEVTLRVPPPLERPLTLASAGDGAELRDGEAVIASGRPVAEPSLSLPDPVSPEDAATARRDAPFQHEHPYSECFVCGPDREPGDGLRVICGPVAGRGPELVAAPWETDESMMGPSGSIADEMIWSVLDCPGGIAAMGIPEFGLSVLGRLTAVIGQPIEPGPDYVAIGWPIERDGRKLQAGSAILDADGKALARASAVWIELAEQPGSSG